MDKIILKVAAGALIPSFATIVFNFLNFLFENFHKDPLPDVSPSTYDVAAGCVFSIIGICVTVQDSKLSAKLLVTCVVLILVVISGDMLAPTLLHLNKLLMVVIVNIISFGALVWAILEAG